MLEKLKAGKKKSTLCHGLNISTFSLIAHLDIVLLNEEKKKFENIQSSLVIWMKQNPDNLYAAKIKLPTEKYIAISCKVSQQGFVHKFLEEKKLNRFP